MKCNQATINNLNTVAYYKSKSVSAVTTFYKLNDNPTLIALMRIEQHVESSLLI